jgi:hypothetical protein
LSWLRHANWVRGLFSRQHIFSPNDDEQIPLSNVYLRQRCYWFSESHLEVEGQTALRRVANVDDLHSRCWEWIRSDVKRDPIRVVAGGPGSGKSSFARAFASEVLGAGEHRVIFIPLQRLTLTSDLSASIGRYLQSVHNEVNVDGSAGLPENPFIWRATDASPILIVFDGLDELSYSDEASKMLARQFIFSVKNLMMLMNMEGPPICALILGRSSACEDALREADIGIEKMLHVAPLKPILIADFNVSIHDDGRLEGFLDPNGLCSIDQRVTYWKQWQKIKGIPNKEMPQSITDDRLSDLNLEPLLLHLLILSDFSESRWSDAVDNKNLVYENIFEKIYERNKKKDLFTARNITKDDFFVLMECLGIAYWHGNGRTGSAEDFRKLRKNHANREKRFGQLESAELSSVALQIHTRRDALTGEGFEFVHKSFGEYLTGRALLWAGIRAARELTSNADSEDIAPRWSQLVGPSEMSIPVLEFVKNEARLASKKMSAAELVSVKNELERFMSWVLKEGMPVHRLDGTFSYRNLETRQRCAETALFCTLNAVACALPAPTRNSENPSMIHLGWHRPDSAAHMLHRLSATSKGPVVQSLSRIDFSNQDLGALDLHEADLSYSDFQGASFRGGIYYGSNMRHCNFERVSFFGVNLVHCDLSNANLERTDLRRANIRGAVFRGANLLEANMEKTEVGGDRSTSPANFRGAKNLTQDQIDQTTGGTRAKLPKKLTAPKHWVTTMDVNSGSRVSI